MISYPFRIFSLLGILLLWIGGLPPVEARELTPGVPPAESGVVTQVFRYELSDQHGEEAFLVWGVDGWKTVPMNLRPPGTFIHANVMNTPMERQGAGFSVAAQIPVGSTIQFGVLVTRFSETRDQTTWWDANEDTSGTVVAQEDGIIEIPVGIRLPGKGSEGFSRNVLVTQEIRYVMPEAAEVFLVWGINGWNRIPTDLRPTGTLIRGMAMYSPMKNEGNAFSVRLRVPRGVKISYGFLITRTRTGIGSDIWENAGGSAFEIRAEPGGTVQVPTKINLAGKTEAPVRFFMHLLTGTGIVVGLAIGMTLLLRLMIKPDRRFAAAAAFGIVGTAICLAPFLFLLRAGIVGFDHSSPSVRVTGLLAAGVHDLAYVLVLAGIFLALLVPMRRRPEGTHLIHLAFLSAALLSLWIASINAKVVPLTGQAVDYQWLYYADFLRTFDARAAVHDAMSWQTFVKLLGASAAMLVLSLLAGRGLLGLSRRISWPTLAAVGLGFSIIYFPAAHYYIQTKGWDFRKIENPVTAFLGSLFTMHRIPQLFSMKTSIGPDDFQTVQDRPPEKSSLERSSDPIQNVILFVVESGGRRYFDGYGGGFSITPELNRYRDRSILFANIYAHAGSTSKSLVSLLNSAYPWISYLTLTSESPGLPLRSISSELAARGFRTGFFTPGDYRYKGMGVYLSFQGFERIEDYTTMDCSHQFNMDPSDSYEFSGGTNEACMIDRFIDWVNADPGRPFFGVLWTYQAHFPYFLTGESVDYGVDGEYYNRYLNALRETDAELGRLLRWLEDRNLASSSLVVVVGDHGEAFGQHGEFGHVTSLYEENLGVPMVLINPTLFSGEVNETIGGLIDVGPTILDILDLSLPSNWQGHSLFSENRSGRAYFFSPWVNRYFGMREGNLKLIFDGAKNTYGVYDLSTDPLERHNIADHHADLVQEGTDRLAAWVQFQKRYWQSIEFATPKP
jgi:lipoteichoic acid synthase